jgi:uncharacterized protein YecT (DUF1311 family)
MDLGMLKGQGMKLLTVAILMGMTGVAVAQGGTRAVVQLESFPLEEALGQYGEITKECAELEGDAAGFGCLMAVHEQAEAKLTEAYRKALATLAAVGESDADLRQAERAWIAFRDANCAVRIVGAEPEKSAKLACLIRAAVLRSAELSQIGD